MSGWGARNTGFRSNTLINGPGVGKTELAHVIRRRPETDFKVTPEAEASPGFTEVARASLGFTEEARASPGL